MSRAPSAQTLLLPGPVLTAAVRGWGCYSGWCCSAGPMCSTEAHPAAPARGDDGTGVSQKKLGRHVTAPSHHIPTPTSVTTLRTPRIRSEVWKRLGLALTASRTRPTKSRSWMGSAHRGPPSCRHKSKTGREQDHQNPVTPAPPLAWPHLVPLPTVLTLRGHRGTAGCRKLDPVQRELVRGRQSWDTPFTSL